MAEKANFDTRCGKGSVKSVGNNDVTLCHQLTTGGMSSPLNRRNDRYRHGAHCMHEVFALLEYCSGRARTLQLIGERSGGLHLFEVVA